MAAESVETGDYAPTMTVGTAQQLSPVVQPQKAASRNGVSYVSDNPNIVSVGEDGVAQAVGLGTANITATCGDVSCTYTITTQPDSTMIATEMDITLASSTIAVGDTTSLSLAVLPTTAANYISVSLSSSDPGVATVNNFGKVTGVAPGKGDHHGHRWGCDLLGDRDCRGSLLQFGVHRPGGVHLPEHELHGAQAGCFRHHHRLGGPLFGLPKADLYQQG